MFFSIGAIANQQNGGTVPPIPGEGSFGNAYTGTPKKVFNFPLTTLGQTGIYILSNTTYEIQKFSQVQDSLGESFDGFYSKDSTKEQLLFKNYSINLRSENGAVYVSNSSFSLLEEETLPPSFLIPDGINFYPYIFCAKPSDRILEVPRFLGEADLVQNLGYSVFSSLSLLISFEGEASFVSKSSKESNKFFHVPYDLVNTGVLIAGNSSFEA
jgi:hypothetical protein